MNPEKRDAIAPAGPIRPLASILTIGAAIVSALFRLVPHPFNMTPIGALGLYGGARLPLGQALALPLAVMAVSDALLHYYVYPTFPMFSWWVYASLGVNVLLGRLLCHTESPWRVGGVTILGSVQFFLVTNFGAWWGSSLYPQTPAGLLESYIAGLAFANRDLAPPLGFFGNSVLGDLMFATLLFGLHAALARGVFPAERVGVRMADK